MKVKPSVLVILPICPAGTGAERAGRDAGRTGDGVGCSLSQLQPLSPPAMGLCLPGTGGAQTHPQGLRHPSSGSSTSPREPAHTLQEISTLLQDLLAQSGRTMLQDETLVYIGTYEQRAEILSKNCK